jgi:hypothetical protein
VVAEVRKVLAERYVAPERRPALDAVLASLSSGRYNVTDPRQLATWSMPTWSGSARTSISAFPIIPSECDVRLAPQRRGAGQ